MGPQHPSTHGVLRLVLELDGETVIACKPIIGYLHTGIEKNTEYRTWMQGVTYVTRADYLSPFFNELGVLPGGRAAARDRGAAARADDPRAVLRAEPDLLAPGVARDGRPRAGRGDVMLYGFREREVMMDIFEVGHRPADEPRVHPDRRRDHGHPEEAPRQDPRVPRPDAGPDRRVRVAAVEQPDLASSATAASACSRPRSRSRSASPGRCCGPPAWPADLRKDMPYCGLRDLRLRRADADRGRLLRPLPASGWTRCAQSLRIVEQCLERLEEPGR